VSSIPDRRRTALGRSAVGNRVATVPPVVANRRAPRLAVTRTAATTAGRPAGSSARQREHPTAPSPPIRCGSTRRPQTMAIHRDVVDAQGEGDRRQGRAPTEAARGTSVRSAPRRWCCRRLASPQPGGRDGGGRAGGSER
jgi:hypothetical protein